MASLSNHFVIVPFVAPIQYIAKNITEEEAYELQNIIMTQDKVLCWVICKNKL
jgi:hypothetical protein